MIDRNLIDLIRQIRERVLVRRMIERVELSREPIPAHVGWITGLPDEVGRCSSFYQIQFIRQESGLGYLLSDEVQGRLQVTTKASNLEIETVTTGRKGNRRPYTLQLIVNIRFGSAISPFVQHGCQKVQLQTLSFGVINESRERTPHRDDGIDVPRKDLDR